jgi:voltage-gated potassium channel
VQSITLRLKIFAAVLVLVIFTGTVGYSALEGIPFSDSFYLTVITVSTVGYGDITPLTTAGKILSLVLVVVGVGTFLGVVANMTDLFLDKREKELRREKLHIIVGVLFSESGMRLLNMFSSRDPDIDKVRERLLVAEKWKASDYEGAKASLAGYEYSVEMTRADLAGLMDFLNSKSELYLRLLENPYILEHETFTDLLRAVLHLKEELLHRGTFDDLPDTDIKHILGDIKRVYSNLVVEWLDYMGYLQRHYPYLFSLARRTNPFDREASVVVK